MSEREFDVVVIGGGSAGYAAARTLAAGGARLAVVEGGREVGGLCILRGCMPTKALLQAAHLRQAIRMAETWGITVSDVQLDVPRLFARKDELIGEFAAYRRQQLEQGRWEFIRARAAFAGPHELILGSGRSLTADHVVIATGSELAPPPVPGLAEAGYLCSDTALRLTRLPKSLIVLGGGAVAVEFAQFFARLGTQVTLIQRGPHLLRGTDEDVVRELEAALRDEGLTLFTHTHIKSITSGSEGKRVCFMHEGREVFVRAEELFHGLGRRPSVSDLNLAVAGVEQDETGQIKTDSYQRSSVPHIFAAGDCCGPHDIVHLAVQQGEIAARNILGHSVQRDDRLLLSVVFTEPEVATLGLTEVEAKSSGVDYVRAVYPFNDHGKSMILGARHGFVKLLGARTTGEILGAACVGPHAGELIHELVPALARRLTGAELAALPHYHPTLAEIWTYPAEEIGRGISGF